MHGQIRNCIITKLHISKRHKGNLLRCAHWKVLMSIPLSPILLNVAFINRYRNTGFSTNTFVKTFWVVI